MFAQGIQIIRDLIQGIGGVSVTVDSSLLQLNSGEDITPTSLETDEYVVCLVGDGHSGDGCTLIINNNAEQILTSVLQTKELEVGFQMCQDLCSKEFSGAMIAITLYNKLTRELEIISAGDISVSAYQNDQMIWSQPIHDCETINQSEELINQLHSFGITQADKCLQMLPQKDGQTMCLEQKESYFLWGANCRIAACSFLGHRNKPRLPPFKRSLSIPEGSWHLTMTSDGVADMIHPENKLLTNFETTAESIVQAAKTRWIEPHFDPLPEEEHSCYNKDGYFRPNEQPSTFYLNNDIIQVQTFNSDGTVYVQLGSGSGGIVNKVDICEKNGGADDISCLIMKVHN